MRICLYVVYLLIFIPGIVAQQAQRSSAQLPKVIVRATALPFPTPLDTSDVTCITADDLKQQQSVTLVDALRRVLGTYITQDGGIGQKATISMRGASTGQTAVILDGMHINDVSADNGAVDLAPWLVDDIAKIRIVRGPLSSLYGSDAIGGVLLIDTKKGKDAFRVHGKAEMGSYHTYQQAAGFQGQKGRVSYQLAASRLQSSGSPVTPDRLHSLLRNKADDPLHQENMAMRLGVERESAYVSFFSRYLTRQLGFRGGSPQRIDPWRQNMIESFNRLQGHFEGSNGKWAHELGVGHYMSNRENQNPFGQKDGENKGTQTQADWQQKLAVNEQVEVQVATQIAQEKFYTHRLLSPANQANSVHGGVGGIITVRTVEPFILSTSARLDKYQGLPTAPTYRLGGEYRLQSTIFKGSVGTGFKAPTLSQRFYKSPSFSGNPNLKPERSFGWDFGVEHSFFHERLNLGITFFQNYIRDLIVFGGNTNINRHQARTQGFEGIIKFQATETWRVELTHTYTQAWDEQTQLTLVRRPRNKATIQLIGQVTSKWQVSGDILCVGPQTDFDFMNYPNRVKMPSYTIVGIQTSYQLNDHWEIYGRGENLLNHRYESPNGYQQPGLGIYGGLRVRTTFAF